MVRVCQAFASTFLLRVQGALTARVRTATALRLRGRPTRNNKVTCDWSSPFLSILLSAHPPHPALCAPADFGWRVPAPTAFGALNVVVRMCSVSSVGSPRAHELVPRIAGLWRKAEMRALPPTTPLFSPSSLQQTRHVPVSTLPFDSTQTRSESTAELLPIATKVSC